MRAGRLLEVAPGSRTGTPPSDYDRALADLRLDELFTEPASPAPEEAGLDDHSPVVSRARLYTPDARLVVTTQVAAVVEAVGHVAAARGVLCVFGDAGRGKTVAVERALRLLPSRVPAWRAAAPIQATLPHLRAALVAALDVSSVAPTHRAQACDRGLIEALQQPGVFFLDDAQRLPPPLLDYLRLLWDAPTTIATLILCGAGCEHVLAQAPALASRVLTWHEVARLDPTRLPYTLPLFHHIWHTAAPDDVRHVDDTVAKGNFRTWAKITSHLHATLVRRPDTVAGRELLKQACARLGPHP
ncbi:AAA family ATPase [Embleya sp. NPDC050154]|uniref:AAA family ATPase n=1 Tax=Embleya sp. NPDC050154 TaxID=3363988 RepID=UPI0037AB0351